MRVVETSYWIDQIDCIEWLSKRKERIVSFDIVYNPGTMLYLVFSILESDTSDVENDDN